MHKKQTHFHMPFPMLTKVMEIFDFVNQKIWRIQSLIGWRDQKYTKKMVRKANKRSSKLYPY